MLTTLLPVTEGTARIAGFDLVKHPEAVRKKIGYVSQMLSADGDLTGYENLLISAKLYGMPRAEWSRRIAQGLEFMELAHVGGKLVHQYSVRKTLRVGENPRTAPRIRYDHPDDHARHGRSRSSM